MNWLRISLFAQLILALYFQAISWLPLGRWNYQPRFIPLATQAVHGELSPSVVFAAGIFAVPFSVYWLAYALRWTWLMWFGLAGYLGWLVMQIQSWWVPYLFGASDKWATTYRRTFSGSTKLLPSFGRHLAPDGMHLVLQLVLIAVVITLLIGLLTGRPAALRRAQG